MKNVGTCDNDVHISVIPVTKLKLKQIETKTAYPKNPHNVKISQIQ